MNNPLQSPVSQLLATMLLYALFGLAAMPAHASTQPYISGHGINFGTGNKYLQETDIRLAGPGPGIAFTRTYNSQSTETSVLGYGWTSPLSERLLFDSGMIILVQSGGRHVFFREESTEVWVNETGARRVITASDSGYLLREKDGATREFDGAGRITVSTDRNGNSRSYGYKDDLLISITGSFGASLSFAYTGERLTSVTSALGTWTYAYDGADNLTSVTGPDGALVTYIYDDPGDAHNLTGVINEEDERILTVAYDAHDRAIQSSKQGGVEEVTISYPATYMREVTDSLGAKTTYYLDVLHGVVKVSSFTGPGCSSCGTSSDTAYLYDDRFRVLEKTEANGKITAYTFDAAGNVLSKTEARGTQLEKTTTSTYTAENRLASLSVASVANPGDQALTIMSYDDRGNLIRKTENGYADGEPISRTTTYGYNGYGQLASIDGPRTAVDDRLTMSYYPNDPADGTNRGQLHTVTNALGQVTTYGDYTLRGQARTITDANGVVTSRSYDPAGRLLTSTTEGLTTSYSYDATGDILSVTRPGGRTFSYGYDEAGRVNRISDSEGNAMIFSYDSEGRKTSEEIRDPEGTLMRRTGFEYTEADRLAGILLPGGAERRFAYDEVGNLVRKINATGLQTDLGYDLLRRLESLTEDGATTSYVYDAAGNVTEVTDARGNATIFTYDDFNRRTSRTAPDTGTTAYAYDAADNPIAITDALGRLVEFTYDALGRPTSQSYGDSTIDLSYDQGENGIGRLSSVEDEHGTSSFSYSTLGQLSEERRTIEDTSYTTGYTYDSATGELAGLTYPSGMTVEYLRDTTGRVSSVVVNGTTVIDAVTHLPFGPLKSATLGDTVLQRGYDQRYDQISLRAGSLDYTYERDAEGHVTAITGLPEPTPAAGADNSTYAADSNRLLENTGAAYSYDAVGNTLSDGRFTYEYDELNRLTRVEEDGTLVAAYGYDAANRRISKTVGATTTHYLYDADSNLIAEAAADGTITREYLYLDGSLIAVNDYDASPCLFYAITDHLGTPQQLITANGTVVWQAAYLPFGKATVTVKEVVNTIRFPGQYYDVETGLHYNWHRFYDPGTGRYISADPIGLDGGINLYAYVQNDPVNKIDPEGLITWWAIPLTITVGETVDYTVQSHYWSQINKMFWEQRRRLKKQLEEVDPYCDPERWKLLYDAYNDLIRRHAKEAAKWGISTVSIGVTHGISPR